MAALVGLVAEEELDSEPEELGPGLELVEFEPEAKLLGRDVLLLLLLRTAAGVGGELGGSSGLH